MNDRLLDRAPNILIVLLPMLTSNSVDIPSYSETIFSLEGLSSNFKLLNKDVQNVGISQKKRVLNGF